MGSERERLSWLLDDLAAERDPAERTTLSPEEMKLAELAVFLKAENTRRLVPDQAFVAASAPNWRQHASMRTRLGSDQQGRRDIQWTERSQKAAMRL